MSEAQLNVIVPEVMPVVISDIKQVPSLLGYSFPIFGLNIPLTKILYLIGFILLIVLFYFIYKKFFKKDNKKEVTLESDQDSHNEELTKPNPEKQLVQQLQNEFMQQQQQLQNQISQNQILQNQIHDLRNQLMERKEVPNIEDQIPNFDK